MVAASPGMDQQGANHPERASCLRASETKSALIPHREKTSQPWLRTPAHHARRHVRLELEVVEPRTLLSLSVLEALVPPPDSLPPVDRLLVKFEPGTPSSAESAILAGAGTSILSEVPDGPIIVETVQGVDPAFALTELQASPLIAYAERDSIITLADTATVLPAVNPIYPANSSFGQQWGLNTPSNIDIDAPEAWAVTTGSPSTIVAVLDTGVDLANPDLVSRLWVNPTASRFRAPVYGWNFLNNNGNVQDANGHGTHVTGIVAATGNSGSSVVGVDWHAQIMPLRILDATGSGSLDAAVSAVYFAVHHGARVINASWGSSIPDPALADAIRYADSKGVVFVNAAGNDGLNNDTVPTYPAAYHTPNMLVVAAVDPDRRSRVLLELRGPDGGPRRPRCEHPEHLSQVSGGLHVALRNLNGHAVRHRGGVVAGGAAPDLDGRATGPRRADHHKTASQPGRQDGQRGDGRRRECPWRGRIRPQWRPLHGASPRGEDHDRAAASLQGPRSHEAQARAAAAAFPGRPGRGRVRRSRFTADGLPEVLLRSSADPKPAWHCPRSARVLTPIGPRFRCRTQGDGDEVIAPLDRPSPIRESPL